MKKPIKKLTAEEWIKKAKDLCKKAPKNIWLYSASGTLHVMKTGSDGEHVHLKNGGIDPDYILDELKISNDGGDW